MSAARTSSAAFWEFAFPPFAGLPSIQQFYTMWDRGTEPVTLDMTELMLKAPFDPPAVFVPNVDMSNIVLAAFGCSLVSMKTRTGRGGLRTHTIKIQENEPMRKATDAMERTVNLLAVKLRRDISMASLAKISEWKLIGIQAFEAIAIQTNRAIGSEAIRVSLTLNATMLKSNPDCQVYVVPRPASKFQSDMLDYLLLVLNAADDAFPWVACDVAAEECDEGKSVMKCATSSNIPIKKKFLFGREESDASRRERLSVLVMTSKLILESKSPASFMESLDASALANYLQPFQLVADYFLTTGSCSRIFNSSTKG